MASFFDDYKDILFFQFHNFLIFAKYGNKYSSIYLKC